LGGQFATLTVIVAKMKLLSFWWNPHYRIKVNFKPNLISFISSSFYHSSFSSPLVELLLLLLSFSPLVDLLLSFCVCLWMVEGVSIFLNFQYDHGKHKCYKNLVFMLIYVRHFPLLLWSCFFSCWASLLLLSFCVCLWMVEGVSIFLNFRYDHGKHKCYKNLVFMLIYGGLTCKI
jgi:hypothetical protein